MRRARLLAVALAFSLPLALAACGGDDIPPPENYQPMHFDYLPKIKLNVGNIVIEDHARPLGPSDIAGQSPLVPATGLEELAHDRLFAGGFSGTATFTIDQASIVQEPNGALYGTLAVHLDVTVPGALQTGFAAAQVQRQHFPGSDPENLQNTLYDLTRQMLDAMNVELEFQVKKSLSSALLTGNAMPAPVQAQPLDATTGAPAAGVAPAPEGAIPPGGLPPGGPTRGGAAPGGSPDELAPPAAAAAAPAAPSPAAPPPPAPPPAPPVSKYQDPLLPSLTAPPPSQAAPPQQQMSPPPGTLQPPDNEGF